MLSRRQFLTRLGTVGAVGAASAAGATGLVACSDASTSGKATDVVEFHGEHQAGILTAQPDQLHFTSFNVTTTDREQLVELLKTWTQMARRMTRGETAVDGGADEVSQAQVPGDTGEAYDLSAKNLTITIGFGPSLFDDRFGLKDKKPAELNELPHFSGDVTIDEISGGDLCIQACADDPQVAMHAVRNLTKAGLGIVEVRWTQMGFGHASATTRDQQTPRNLFGFKDGTNNMRAEDTDLVNEHLWVSHTGTWHDGGTFLIARRIRMLIENWDRQVLSDQEATFGRKKISGAPLGRDNEFDELPLDEYAGTSGPVVPLTSHARLASHQENNGARMLRRAYNFAEGTDSYGHLNAGLFFIAMVASPEKDFIPIQSKLAKSDKMNEYVRYESKSIFAIAPGVKDENDYFGSGLFA